MSALQRMVSSKKAQWASEAMTAAAMAVQSGDRGQLVEYPTGIKMVRFGKPSGACWFWNEVTPEAWAYLQSTGGKIRS